MLAWSSLGDVSAQAETDETREAAEARCIAAYNTALETECQGSSSDARGAYASLLQDPAMADFDELKPVRFLCLKNLARLEEACQEEGQLRAIGLYVQATELDSTDVVIWLRLAKLSRLFGRLRLARSALECVLQLHPNHLQAATALRSIRADIGVGPEPSPKRQCLWNLRGGARADEGELTKAVAYPSWSRLGKLLLEAYASGSPLSTPLALELTCDEVLMEADAEADGEGEGPVMDPDELMSESHQVTTKGKEAGKESTAAEGKEPETEKTEKSKGKVRTSARRKKQVSLDEDRVRLEGSRGGLTGEALVQHVLAFFQPKPSLEVEAEEDGEVDIEPQWWPPRPSTTWPSQATACATQRAQLAQKWLPKWSKASDSECKACDDGGSLLCCDFCPSVFHPTCLPDPREADASVFACKECKELALEKMEAKGMREQREKLGRGELPALRSLLTSAKRPVLLRIIDFLGCLACAGRQEIKLSEGDLSEPLADVVLQLAQVVESSWQHDSSQAPATTVLEAVGSSLPPLTQLMLLEMRVSRSAKGVDLTEEEASAQALLSYSVSANSDVKLRILWLLSDLHARAARSKQACLCLRGCSEFIASSAQGQAGVELPHVFRPASDQVNAAAVQAQLRAMELASSGETARAAYNSMMEAWQAEQQEGKEARAGQQAALEPGAGAGAGAADEGVHTPAPWSPSEGSMHDVKRLCETLAARYLTEAGSLKDSMVPELLQDLVQQGKRHSLLAIMYHLQELLHNHARRIALCTSAMLNVLQSPFLVAGADGAEGSQAEKSHVHWVHYATSKVTLALKEAKGSALAALMQHGAAPMRALASALALALQLSCQADSTSLHSHVDYCVRAFMLVPHEALASADIIGRSTEMAEGPTSVRQDCVRQVFRAVCGQVFGSVKKALAGQRRPKTCLMLVVAGLDLMIWMLQQPKASYRSVDQLGEDQQCSKWLTPAELKQLTGSLSGLLRGKIPLPDSRPLVASCSCLLLLGSDPRCCDLSVGGGVDLLETLHKFLAGDSLCGDSSGEFLRLGLAYLNSRTVQSAVEDPGLNGGEYSSDESSDEGKSPLKLLGSAKTLKGKVMRAIGQCQSCLFGLSILPVTKQHRVSPAAEALGSAQEAVQLYLQWEVYLDDCRKSEVTRLLELVSATPPFNAQPVTAHSQVIDAFLFGPGSDEYDKMPAELEVTVSERAGQSGGFREGEADQTGVQSLAAELRPYGKMLARFYHRKAEIQPRPKGTSARADQEGALSEQAAALLEAVKRQRADLSLSPGRLSSWRHLAKSLVSLLMRYLDHFPASSADLSTCVVTSTESRPADTDSTVDQGMRLGLAPLGENLACFLEEPHMDLQVCRERYRPMLLAALEERLKNAQCSGTLPQDSSLAEPVKRLKATGRGTTSKDWDALCQHATLVGVLRVAERSLTVWATLAEKRLLGVGIDDEEAALELASCCQSEGFLCFLVARDICSRNNEGGERQIWFQRSVDMFHKAYQLFHRVMRARAAAVSEVGAPSSPSSRPSLVPWHLPFMLGKLFHKVGQPPRSVLEKLQEVSDLVMDGGGDKDAKLAILHRLHTTRAKILLRARGPSGVVAPELLALLQQCSFKCPTSHASSSKQLANDAQGDLNGNQPAPITPGAVLANCIEALSYCLSMDRWFYKATYSHALLLWKCEDVEGLPLSQQKVGAEAALDALHDVFSKRDTLVHMFNRPAGNRYEELEQSQRKFSSLRRKYMALYIQLLEASRNHTDLFTLYGKARASKGKDDPLLPLWTQERCLEALLREMRQSLDGPVGAAPDASVAATGQGGGEQQPSQELLELPQHARLGKAWQLYLHALDLDGFSDAAWASRVLAESEALLTKAYEAYAAVQPSVVEAITAQQHQTAGTSLLAAVQSCCHELWPEKGGKGKQAKAKFRLRPSQH